MLGQGVRKAWRLAAFELGVAVQIVDSGSSERLTAALRTQDCGHARKSREVQGHQCSVLYRIAAVGTHTSATSSDFACPIGRAVTVGSTSYLVNID